VDAELALILFSNAPGSHYQSQGDINCDDLGPTNTCWGIVQVCGPISETHKLEIIALKTTVYSVSVVGRSKEVLDGNSPQSHFSKTDLNNLAIRQRSREIVFLHYSRDPQENVTAQLQQGHESLSHLSSSD
jgi:hypothetical protein